jgi:hypothetical protein
MKPIKRIDLKLVEQPKNKCINFDSDCLLIECHLSCWVSDKKKGYCPFLQDKNKLHYK